MGMVKLLDWCLDRLFRLPHWFARKIGEILIDPIRAFRVRIYLQSRDVDVRGRRIAVSGPIHLDMSPGAKVSIGNNLRLSRCSIRVDERGTLSLGENVIIQGADVWVASDASLILDDHVLIERVEPFPLFLNIMNGTARIGAETRMRASCRIRYGGTLLIGKNNFINQGSDIRCDFSIEIGDSNLISYEVNILDTNTHSTDWRVRSASIRRHKVVPEPRPAVKAVIIGDNCWIGKCATILKGSKIGNCAVIGAAAMVGCDVQIGRAHV